MDNSDLMNEKNPDYSGLMNKKIKYDPSLMFNVRMTPDQLMRNDTAKHIREIRKILHSNIPIKEDHDTYYKDWRKASIIVGGIILLILVCSFLLQGCSIAAEIPSDKAIKAIIGEAENQGYTGMLAVAGAIHNRGSLKGVYGLHSYRVRHHLYSDRTYKQACRAWNEALKGIDITHGATGWGNDSDVAIFKNSQWFSSVYFTAHIGDHWFYTTE